jgi:hypothetical protein
MILFTNLFFAQNRRDTLIQDSIYPILHNENAYNKVKRLIIKLEKEYGEEPDLKYKLLSNSFKNGDISYFKQELKKLVRNNGLNIIYFKGNESYYEPITIGYLSRWFKRMYLRNHMFWMDHNFLKQIDQKKLNEIKTKDQLVNSFSIKVNNEVKLDSLQKSKILTLLQDFFFENISELYGITRKYNNLPTAKSFAIIQNHYGIALLHNEQAKNNFAKTWTLFYPYYKKAYLNNEIDYVVFINHDNWSYVHNGYQIFGLLKVKNIPDIFKKENLDTVPIIDFKYYDKIRKEFNWD